MLFPQSLGKCQGIPHKDGAWSALFLISELCCSMYCLRWWIVLFYILFVSIVLFYVFFVCKCVLYYCHRVVTQLQLNIYHIISFYTSTSTILHKNMANLLVSIPIHINCNSNLKNNIQIKKLKFTHAIRKNMVRNLHVMWHCGIFT